jgi:ubiquinone/menaquinone biosynthesis C-methylase UbiE
MANSLGTSIKKMLKKGVKASGLSFADRSNYKKTWDQLADNFSDAKMFVAGYEDEAKFELTAHHTVDILEQYAGIKSTDVALEIGCGVGRVGKVLSKRVTKWIGTDISGNMLAYAAQRLKGIENIELLELSTVGLKEIPDRSIDLVYCTVVFMHLLEWDRYRYVAESFRVLKSGGRCFFDNVDIISDHGWEVFSAGYANDVESRPSQLSMTSSGDELRTYAEKAGFQNVQIYRWDNAWVGVTGVKP